MPALRITLAGQVTVSAESARVGEDRLGGRQGRLLFAYLVTQRGRPVPRDELADVLWGESPPATWEKALTVRVSNVRAALSESGFNGAITLTGARGYYRLDLPDGTWVDIAAAEDAARDAATALAEKRFDHAIERAHVVLGIASQSFLPGDAGRWVEGKRRELADVLDEALACAVDAQLALRRPGEAARLAEEAIALQPFRESGYRRLMQAHAAAGNRAEALRVYDRCRRLLSEELGAYPSPETEAIFRELLREPSYDARPATDAVSRVANVAPPGAEAGEPGAEADEAAPAAGAGPRLRSTPVALGIAGALVVAAIVALSGGGSQHAIGANMLASLDAGSTRLAGDTTVERPYDALAAADGALWAVDSANNAAVHLDPKDGSVRDTVPVGAEPGAVAVGLGSVWVANAGEGTVSRISAQRGAVVQTIGVGNGPSALAVGAGSLWVADRLDSAVVRIDPARGRVTARIPVSAAPADLAYAAGSIWVTGDAAAIVLRIDPATDRVVESFNVGRGADHIAGSSRSVWVANSGDGTVTRIDPSTRAVTSTVAVGGTPVALAVSGDAVWAARAAPAALVRVDQASHVVRTTPLSAPPRALAAQRGRLWVATGSVGRRGGAMHVVVEGGPEERPSVDPAQVYDANKWMLMATAYDGLVGYKRVGGSAGNTLVPDLARSIPAPTDGGRTYTFELRRGIRFSNGKPVRARDVRHTFERLLAIGPPGAGYFSALRKRDGVVADDARGTVVFHLTRRDPEFAPKLALSFAWVVPASAPLKDARTRPLAGTGPYRIASFVPTRRLTLVRNPHFRAWSTDAQPPANADRIETTFAANDHAALSPARIDKADVALGAPRPADAAALLARYASRIKTHPTPATMLLFMNTRAPPFDDVRMRRAVNFALDRGRLARLAGAPLLAQPACQALPPGLPGYRPYCPYTRSPGRAGVWSAPDLATARRLVRESGRHGTRVTVWGFHLWADLTRDIARTLNQIGLHARPRLVSSDRLFTAAADSRSGVQIALGGWGADYPTALGYLFNVYDCRAFVPASRANVNYSEFCDRKVESAMARAVGAEESDLGASARLWASVDRLITDAAPTASIATNRRLAVVSKRVENYQSNPEWGPLLSQASLR
jgi:YVTN family beta-propeller protein